MQTRFRDRREAGRLLAARLASYANGPDVLVLALPRGGVPVAHEVARALGAPLDVFLVRKLGVPGQEELAMGAVATGDVRVINKQIVHALRIPDHVIDMVAAKEQEELARRERLYRGDRLPPEVRGRTVILVDDGLATGASMQAAITALRQHHPPVSSWRCRRQRPRPARRCGQRLMTSYARSHRSRFTPSVSGTEIFRRQPTTRSKTCSRGACPWRIGPGKRPAVGRTTDVDTGAGSAGEERVVHIAMGPVTLEEPGALDRVARLAREWFERHLTPVMARAHDD